MPESWGDDGLPLLLLHAATPTPASATTLAAPTTHANPVIDMAGEMPRIFRRCQPRQPSRACYPRAVRAPLVLVLLAIVACTRGTEGVAPAPTESTPAASGSPSPPEQPAPPDPAAPVDLSISLKATPGPDGTSADVHALIPGLSIDEPLGNIQGAAACTSWWRAGVWSVSCTPGYRTLRLSFRPGPGALVVERTGVASRSVPIPPGAVFSGPQQSVGVRDALDGGCGAGAGTADVQVTTQAELGEARGIGLSLVAGGMTVFLGVMKGAGECASRGAGDERTLACDGRPACMLRASAGRVDFACDLPEHGVGALLLPCGGGAKVRLPTGALPRTTHSP